MVGPITVVPLAIVPQQFMLRRALAADFPVEAARSALCQ